MWYKDHDGENKVGKWLGPVVGIGGGDCFWILPKSARPIARSTVWTITQEELTVEAIKETIRELDLSIKEKIGDQIDDDEYDLDYDADAPRAAPPDDYFHLRGEI